MNTYNDVAQKLLTEAQETGHARLSVNYGLILDGWIENGFFQISVRRKRGKSPSTLELGCLLKAIERLFNSHPIKVEKFGKVYGWTWKVKGGGTSVET